MPAILGYWYGKRPLVMTLSFTNAILTRSVNGLMLFHQYKLLKFKVPKRFRHKNSSGKANFVDLAKHTLQIYIENFGWI